MRLHDDMELRLQVRNICELVHLPDVWSRYKVSIHME